jgi:hypothetical protein
MPRRKKLKEIKLFNNEKAVEDFFDIIFHVGKKVYDNVTKKQEPQATPEPKPSPRPQEVETKAPPLPTFMQEVKTSHERHLEQRKAEKQFLRRLG